MKSINRIFLLFAFILFLSCEDQGLIIKCPDCTAEEPKDTNLEVKLSLGNYGRETQINVYEGNLEDSVLYNTYQTTGEYITVPATLNKKYTLTATYYFGNYYVAIDAATPRVKFDKTQCDDPCYFVYDKVIDLRLKYTK